MDRTQLDTRHRAAIGRWWVILRDAGGRPPQQLLDELALIAREYAVRPAPPARKPAARRGKADGAGEAS